MATSAPSHDVKAFGNFVTLQTAPSKVSWEVVKLSDSTSVVPGPDDWAMVAMLEFDQEPFERVSATLRSAPEVSAELTPATSLDWLKREADGCLEKAPTGVLRWNIKAHQAKALARPPLTDGYVVVVEKKQRVFLVLWTR